MKKNASYDMDDFHFVFTKCMIAIGMVTIGFMAMVSDLKEITKPTNTFETVLATIEFLSRTIGPLLFIGGMFYTAFIASNMFCILYVIYKRIEKQSSKDSDEKEH